MCATCSCIIVIYIYIFNDKKLAPPFFRSTKRIERSGNYHKIERVRFKARLVYSTINAINRCRPKKEKEKKKRNIIGFDLPSKLPSSSSSDSNHGRQCYPGLVFIAATWRHPLSRPLITRTIFPSFLRPFHYQCLPYFFFSQPKFLLPIINDAPRDRDYLTYPPIYISLLLPFSLRIYIYMYIFQRRVTWRENCWFWRLYPLPTRRVRRARRWSNDLFLFTLFPRLGR